MSRELCAVFPRGYLPMDCPSCGRHRVEYGVNAGGSVIYIRCEKCGADSDTLTLTSDSPLGPREAARLALLAEFGRLRDGEPLGDPEVRVARVLDTYDRFTVEASDVVGENDRLREALHAIAAYTHRVPHHNLGAACGKDVCIGCLIHETAVSALPSTQTPEEGK